MACSGSVAVGRWLGLGCGGGETFPPVDFFLKARALINSFLQEMAIGLMIARRDLKRGGETPFRFSQARKQ